MGLKLLLRPQVDAQSHDGLTALAFAAAAGHLDIVTMLSQNAAKVDPPPPKKNIFVSLFCLGFFGGSQFGFWTL